MAAQIVQAFARIKGHDIVGNDWGSANNADGAGGGSHHGIIGDQGVGALNHYGDPQSLKQIAGDYRLYGAAIARHLDPSGSGAAALDQDSIVQDLGRTTQGHSRRACFMKLEGVELDDRIDTQALNADLRLKYVVGYRRDADSAIKIDGRAAGKLESADHHGNSRLRRNPHQDCAR